MVATELVTSENQILSKEVRKPVLKLENVSKKYGRHLAVDDVTIEVYEGETIGLVGPNGAGKTTIIKMIAKLLRPTEGKVLIQNKQGELQDLNKSSRNLIHRGFLIDVPRFYDMTAHQILKFFASSQNYPKEKINERINTLLQLFKLSEWKYKKVKTFSKGMTQKLGIIQAILVDPQIIILDEPQTGLDPKARIEIRAMIRELQSQGKTIFVASHMLHEISEVCDKIAIINHGSIIGFNTIDNLEKDLATKEINCHILDPIPLEKLEVITERLVSKLQQYLDNSGDDKSTAVPLKYNPENLLFKFYYDGKRESRGKILEILITEFKSDFTVISYTRPQTSKLEQIYLELIIDDEPKIKLKRRSEK